MSQKEKYTWLFRILMITLKKGVPIRVECVSDAINCNILKSVFTIGDGILTNDEWSSTTRGNEFYTCSGTDDHTQRLSTLRHLWESTTILTHGDTNIICGLYSSEPLQALHFATYKNIIQHWIIEKHTIFEHLDIKNFCEIILAIGKLSDRFPTRWVLD